MTTRIVACDTETTGLSVHAGCRPFAFSFTPYEGKDAYVRFPVDPFTRNVLYSDNPSAFRMLRDFFLDESITKVFHNAAFDLAMLDAAGLTCKGRFYDTRILAHLADSSRITFELKPLTKSMFGFPDEDQKDLLDSVKKARRLGKKLGWKLADDVKADYALGDPELCKKYAIGDTQRTMKLFKAYEPLLTETQDQFSPYSHYKTISEMEHKLVPVVMAMSQKGVAVDVEKAKELEAYYRGWIDKTKAEMAALGYPNLNPDSPQELMSVFYYKLKMPIEYRTRKNSKGQKVKTKTADKAAIEKWSSKHPLAKSLLEYAEASHQLNSFILPFINNSFTEDGHMVLHPGFNTRGPITGRMSCSNPNLQNITAPNSPGRRSDVEFKARECFIPRKGKVWLLADYSQVEIVCTAYSSRDTVMIDALERGEKLHDITCKNVLKGDPDKPTWSSLRKMAKIVNFLLQYMGTPPTLADSLGCPLEEAKRIYEAYWETYVGLNRFYKSLQKQYKIDGFVKDVFGQSYRVALERHSYKLGNYVSQGPAARLIKEAMLAVAQDLLPKYPGVEMLLQVHDELIFEADIGADLDGFVRDLVPTMAGDWHKLFGMPKPFQIEVSIAKESWGKKEKWAP